jgi:hypothetical protein
MSNKTEMVIIPKEKYEKLVDAASKSSQEDKLDLLMITLYKLITEMSSARAECPIEVIDYDLQKLSDKIYNALHDDGIDADMMDIELYVKEVL